MTDKFIKFISTDETEVPITVSSDGKTDPSGNPSFAFPGGGGGGGDSSNPLQCAFDWFKVDIL